MPYGDGTHVDKSNAAIMTGIELLCKYGCSDDHKSDHVTCKDDLQYDDLCTLESLLSYFNHDVSLDMEIAALKEKALLSQYNILKAEIEMANRYEKMMPINADEDYNATVSDALMLMSYINPADLPEEEREKIISDAIYDPSILLKYVPEDIRASVFKGMEDE